MFLNTVIDGMIADFDISKISLAIQKAFEATATDSYFEQSSEEERENYHTFVRIMAELDWPAFLEYDPTLHSEIISCVEAGDAKGITDALYSHFGALFLKELEVRLEESAVIRAERLPAIREALLLYQLGYYYGAVAILITQMEGILSDIDEYITHTGQAWNAYSCSYDGDRTIQFLTANGPSCKVTQALSEVYADVTMIHEWDGGYLADCCGKVQFKSGKSETEVFSRPCSLDIKVPSSLGCYNDRYGCWFSPELHGVDRNDQTALVKCALRFAIKNAETQGIIQRGHFTDEEFARALKIALDDIEENRPRNRYGIPATSPFPKS